MSEKETSRSIASIAGAILAGGNPLDDKATLQALSFSLVKHGFTRYADNTDVESALKKALKEVLAPVFADMLSLAGTALAQFEDNDKPIVGTHAYDMLAAYAEADVATTETLIHMVAATVLAKLIEDEGGGRSNVEFSPLDMSAMHDAYHMDVERDGIVTKIKLRPKRETDILTIQPRIMLQDEDVSDAKPQVAPLAERPWWGVIAGGELVFVDRQRGKAEAYLSAVMPDISASLQNRMCQHDTCPAAKCNIPEPEVTSES
jgi:hypothetical protein